LRERGASCPHARRDRRRRLDYTVGPGTNATGARCGNLHRPGDVCWLDGHWRFFRPRV